MSTSGVTNIQLLPIEILVHIASFLESDKFTEEHLYGKQKHISAEQQITRCEQVCKAWNIVFSSNAVWKRLNERDGPYGQQIYSEYIKEHLTLSPPFEKASYLMYAHTRQVGNVPKQYKYEYEIVNYYSKTVPQREWVQRLSINS